MNGQFSLSELPERVPRRWKIVAVLVSVYGPPLIYMAITYPSDALPLSLLGAVLFPVCYLEIAYHSLIGADISHVSYAFRFLGSLVFLAGIIVLTLRGYVSFRSAAMILVSQCLFLFILSLKHLPFPPDVVRY